MNNTMISKKIYQILPFQKRQLKAIITVSFLFMAVALYLCSGTEQARADWKYTEFEENIDVNFRPKTPNNMEPVNVTIIVKGLQTLDGANLHFNYSYMSYHQTGGVIFYPIPENPYAMFAVIPGYPGTTYVQFYIEAWNEQHDVIVSQSYSYSVETNNSWKYSTFEENVDVSFSPHVPGPDDEVNITIKSKSDEVPIQRADVYFMFKPENIAEQGPYKPFSNQIDALTVEVTINSYPAGTKISFWIEAYDNYNTLKVSSRYNYSVKSPGPGVVIWEQPLLIQLYDDTGHILPDAKVNVRNASWSKDYKTDEYGTILTDPLYNDHYYVTVTYMDSIETQEIDIPNDENNFTLLFVIDKTQLLSERHGIEKFPQWYVGVGFAVILVFMPLLYISYAERRRELVSQRRAEKIYKTMETHREERPWDPILVPFKPIFKIFEDEPKRIGLSQFIAFFVLGLLGTAWAPFYPWWFIIILGFTVASISYRFPYLALIILSLFVLASTAYQAPEFGIIFMVFSLLIIICAFFNWKFGYLVFLTLFISHLGIMIFVPITAAILYSVSMGIAVMVISGLFVTFLITCGNLTNLSFLIGPPHSSAFIIFNKPAPSEFIPVQFVDALGSLSEPNLDLINSIFRSNYNSLVPIIEIVIWALAIYLIYFITVRYSEKNFEQYLSFLLIPLTLFPLTAISALAYFDYKITPELGLLSIATIGIGLTGVLTAFAIKEFYPSLFKKEIERDIIGTRISQLMTLRRTSFKSVGGLDEVKRELRNAITVPLLRPKLSRLYGVNPPKGVMLFGPPGCGKTLLMRALATELNVEMIGVKCSDIMSKWYGESEEMTARMFKIARNRKPCILFLDEIDAVAKRRSFYSTDDVTPRLLSIMLNELDGMDESAGIMVVGATNMPELIDPALMRPGRFDKIVYIPPPDFESRKEIFKLYLRNKPLAPGVNYYELAGSSDGFSGADIENVVKEASMLAMRRTIETRRRAFITMDDLRAILKQIKPSVSKKMQKEFEQLGFDYSRTTEQKKKKKKTKISEREPEEDEAVSWAEDKEEDVETEEEEVVKKEPPVWDSFAPKKPPKRKRKPPKKKPVEEEEVVFEEVGSEEEEEAEEEEEDEPEIEITFDEDSDTEESEPKGPYKAATDEDDDYWM